MDVVPRNEALARIEISVQAVILFLAITGNSLVLLSMKMRTRHLSRMHMFIVHLCIADLFVALFSVLPQMSWDITYRFYGGDAVCRIVKYFQVVAMYASSYVLVMTAIDRYFAICHPLISHKWTTKVVHKMIFIAWLLSLLFAVPQMIIFALREVKPGSATYDCWSVFEPLWMLQVYITWVTVAVYIAPTIILTICYGFICHAVWKSGKFSSVMSQGTFKTDLKRTGGLLGGLSEEKLNNRAINTPGDCSISRAKIKTVKLTLTVITCYLICWSPFFIGQMWSAYDINAPFQGKSIYLVRL